MAFSRTTADYVSAVLRKCGESTVSGISQYTTDVVEYLNKVHTAVISGGNIFDLEVDENFAWAKSRNPMIITLQPKYTTGTITLSPDTTVITFSVAPTISLKGWHIRLPGEYTTYRIMSHTASTTTANLDAVYVGSQLSSSFTAFKLDYDVLPEQIYVDSGINDSINFIESGTTQLTATLTANTYTPSAFATAIATALNAAGTHGNTYTCTYSTTTNYFTLTSNLSGSGTPVFSLLGATGTNSSSSALPTAGFDYLDFTGADTYTGTYKLGTVCRLVAPFVIYNGPQSDPYIEGIDPVTMQEDYPVGDAVEGIPRRFAVIREDVRHGNFQVRFDRYPSQEMKVEIPYVPLPYDLQNNTASIPKIPRKYSDVLEYGAAFFLALDKNDDKAQGFLGLAKAMLQSMQQQNRSMLKRVSQSFGEIIPRADLRPERRRLNYGYPVTGSSTPVAVGATTPSMYKYTFSFAQFQTAALSNTLLIQNLPANYTLFAVIIKHNQAFVGSGITTFKLDVGTVATPNQFITAFDATVPVASTAQDSQLVLYYPAAITALNVRAVATGANLSNLTAGSVDIFLQEVITG